MLVLASSVAARAITSPDMKYVFIHPYTRMPVLHSSGILELVEERVDSELEANMAGRVGRTCEGIVTYLYDVNDSDLALQALPASVPAASVADHGDRVMTLVLAPSRRLYYARHTMQHSIER